MVRLGESLSQSGRAFIEETVEASEDFVRSLESKFRISIGQDLEDVSSRIASKIRAEAFRAANSAKFERELDEKYGMFKDVILHPTVQWILAAWAELWNSFHVFGRPPLGTTAGVIVGLMIYRRNTSGSNKALAAAILSGLNPLVVVGLVLLWKMWVGRKHLPRGWKMGDETEFDTPLDLGEDKLSDDYSPDKVDPVTEGGGGEG
ncbi:unnamed protein product, partial [Discosporangium mesarthrocarpum]